jgi:hypothetical protein
VNRILAAAAIALGLSAPVAAHASELTAAEVDALPCAGPPHTRNEAEGVRMAHISLGMSIEKYALGQSKNPQADAAAAAATTTQRIK